MLKFALLLMMLHALPETHFSNAQSVRADMLVSAPAQVRVTRGSCLVIPCSFSLPKNAPAVSIYNGLWKKLPDRVIVAQSNGKLPHQNYRGRTRFLGSAYKRNCTWMLWDVRDSDEGLYFFRIEVPGYDSYSWNYQPTKLQVIDFEDRVQNVVDGGPAGGLLAYHARFYSCPHKEPVLHWNIWNGTTLSRSNWVDTWKWMTYSILHFYPPQNKPIPNLYCFATYNGVRYD